MDYLKYVMIVGLASLSVAGITCVALWLMGPVILARMRPEPPEPEETRPAPPQPAVPPQRGMTFDFTAAQAPALAGLLKKEGPEDIAVVVSRLPADAGRALLAALAPELRLKVLQSLASPRTVSVELMRGMKTELENRLYGVVGGPAEAAPFIKDLPYREKKALLENIYAENPARGAELRSKFILDEDLPGLTDSDLRALVSSLPVEAMGAYMPALPEKLAARIKGQYSGKDALALQRVALSAPQGADEKDAALAGFVELAEKMAAKGLIERPKPQSAPKAAPKPAPAPAASAAPAAAAKPKRQWG